MGEGVEIYSEMFHKTGVNAPFRSHGYLGFQLGLARPS